MIHLNDATASTVRDVLVRNADRNSTLYTDESRLYTVTGGEYARHDTVKHSAKEYARREGDVRASASPIGGLVKPVTPKQKARRILRLPN